MNAYIFESEKLFFVTDDCGCAKIAEVYDKNNKLFVRIQSWDEETKEHIEARELEGKRVRVTIEVIEDGNEH
jgi:hypothetical protein